MSDPQWRLVDYFERVGEEEEFPEYAITNETELRLHLTTLSNAPPRIVELYPPSDGYLRVGIGGRFAALGLVIRRDLGYVVNLEVKILLAEHILADSPVDFEIEGAPSRVAPDALHPPEYIINLACYYFTNRALPESLAWRRS